ncbi:MAG: hypothetical protein L0207_00535 [Chlamydiae bacterium]|nr:hypothetical protein [Chlamydiota bacterium]
MVQLSDTNHRASKKTLECPLCRRVTPLPTKHSAEQIIDWVNFANKAKLVAGGVLGLTIGFGIAKISKRSSILEQICKIAQQKLQMPPNLFFPVTLGGLSFIGSYFLRTSWVARGVTLLYNWIHETNIQPFDIWIYNSGQINQTLENQVSVVMAYFVAYGLAYPLELSKRIPFDQEERKFVDLVSQKLKPLLETKNNLMGLIAAHLRDNHGDVFNDVLRLNCHLLESDGNEELKEEINTIVRDYLLDFFKSEPTFIITDANMSIRIALVTAIELFKDKMEFEDLKKSKEFKQLLTSFQQECRTLDSSLISDIKTGMTDYDFSKISLVSLLWDENLEDEIIYALNTVRKETFEQNGFYLEGSLINPFFIF